MTSGAIALTRGSDGAGQPAGPAALGAPGDHEMADHRNSTRCMANACSASIAFTRLLTIGNKQRPIVVAGLEIADESLRDEGVFLLAVQKRLIGDAEQEGDRSVRLLGHVHADENAGRARLAPLIPEHDRLRRLDALGDVDLKLMLPLDSLPRLRDELDVVDRAGRVIDLFLQLPGERIVRLLDVIEKIGTGAAAECKKRGGGQEPKCGARVHHAILAEG